MHPPLSTLTSVDRIEINLWWQNRSAQPSCSTDSWIQLTRKPCMDKVRECRNRRLFVHILYILEMKFLNLQSYFNTTFNTEWNKRNAMQEIAFSTKFVCDATGENYLLTFCNNLLPFSIWKTWTLSSLSSFCRAKCVQKQMRTLNMSSAKSIPIKKRNSVLQASICQFSLVLSSIIHSVIWKYIIRSLQLEPSFWWTLAYIN